MKQNVGGLVTPVSNPQFSLVKAGITAPKSAMDITFKKGKLTLGLLSPIESYAGDTPKMKHQEELAQLAERLGYTTIWFRDVPLRVPTFGDVGQVFDPFVYMSWIAAHTDTIGLATAAIVLPLRHPLHTAKMATSIDQLSRGRFLLGVSSGDRPEEYPSFNVEMETRGEAFRQNVEIIQASINENFPQKDSSIYGNLSGNVDLLPKPAQPQIPLVVVGGSQQSIPWIAEHGQAWIMYPRPLKVQAQITEAWRTAVEEIGEVEVKPFAQSLYIDLVENPDTPATPIHLGFRSGRKHLLQHLNELNKIGVSHVALNLKHGSRPAKDVVQEIGEYMIPQLS